MSDPIFEEKAKRAASGSPQPEEQKLDLRRLELADDVSMDAVYQASQPEGWQPIASAPKNFESILCRAEDGEQFVAFWSDASQRWVLNGCVGSPANARQFIEWRLLPPAQTDAPGAQKD